MMVSFTARRSKAEMVTPARATPRETMPLSDLDDDWDLRFLQSCVEFFSPVGGRGDDDGGHGRHNPAEAIKEALAEALVHYYPIAGRLRELPEGRLVVDCTGEGVVFVEAKADVRLVELGEPPVPPFPCAEFLCDVGDAGDIIGSPLFFIQVTQLKCGGFVIGSHICHNIADGFGTIQFLKAIADIVRGEAKPTIFPVWEREILMARIPPRINPKYDTLFDQFSGPIHDDIMLTTPTESMVCEYFTFSPSDIAALRRLVPAHLTNLATSFELLTVAMWRSRTMALGYQPSDKVRLMFTMNARGRLSKLPKGYYGNAILSPVVETTVSELCESSLSHTIELIRKAKQEMMEEENMQYMVDLVALLRERPPLNIERTYISSDIKWIGQTELDFGWAKRIGGGIPATGDQSCKIVSDHSMYKNDKGERIIVVSMLLPRSAMDIFQKEIAVYLKKTNSK